MIVFRHTGIELKRIFKGPLGKVVLLALLIVPILYGALYLWAFLDPYGMIDHLPVALVNMDKPYTSDDGTLIEGGKDLTKEILDSDTFKWEVVSKVEAQKGLRENKYFLAMYIPSDFSQKIATANTDDPVPAMVYSRAQLANNFLTSQIGARVFLEIQTQASAKISETYYKEIFKSFGESRTSLTEAQDGAADLHSGLKTAQNGAGELADGLGTARSGTGELKSGSKALSTGLSELDAGGKTLMSSTGELASKSKKLNGGVAKLNGGAQKLDNQIPGLVSGAKQVDDGVALLQDKMGTAATGAGSLAMGTQGNLQYVNGLANIIQTLLGTDGSQLSIEKKQEILTTVATAKGAAEGVKDGASSLSAQLSGAAPSVNELKKGTDALYAGTLAVQEGTGELAAGTQELSSSTDKLASGTDELNAGAEKISKNLGVASSGAQKLNTGATKLSQGTVKLEEGAVQLHSGLKPAVSGSLTLAKGLQDGIKELPDFTKNQQAANAKMMSNPVHLDSRDIGKTKNYGSGFAPYFLPLALWVGVLIGYLFLDPLPGSRNKKKTFGLSMARAIAGYIPMAIIGLVQTLILLLVVKHGLGVTPVRSTWFWVILIASSLCYTAILQWLNASFGPIGKFFAIIFLMLQLTSAAGTFPIQLQSPFFQYLHPFMPMSYIVAGLREALAGGTTTIIVHNIIVIACIGVVAFILTVFAADTKLSDFAKRLSEKVGL